MTEEELREIDRLTQREVAHRLALKKRASLLVDTTKILGYKFSPNQEVVDERSGKKGKTIAAIRKHIVLPVSRS